MFKQLLDPLKTSSFFIFGARGTGKSTYIEQNFKDKDCFKINLLNPEIENS